MHSHLLYNGQIRDTREALLCPGQVGYMNGWGVFSTLRVNEGVLFAFERHYDRMKHDAARMRVPFDLSAPQLEGLLLELVAANRAYDATLRVALVRNKGGLFEGPGLERASDLVAFTADLKDWGKGVKLSYVPHARHGQSPFSGAKITSWVQNLNWYEEAHERGFDEVILLNELGQVSECTSANIFVIRKDRVQTPPVQGSGCLPGVTRAVLLEEIHVPGLTVSEADLTPSELEDSDQVFITSTTRDLLPVFEIDGASMRQASDKLEALKTAFRRYRSEYTARHSRNREPVVV